MKRRPDAKSSDVPAAAQAVAPDVADQEVGGLPAFMTLAEVARLLRRTERALFEWRRKKVLRVTKIGRTVLVRREDFLRLVNGGE
jgi:excisionase family DNA binding protein